MKSVIKTINRGVLRWNSKLEEAIGLRLEPHILIVCATIPSLRFSNLRRVEPVYDNLPLIYVITPTYARYVQKAELTRLSQTLMLVPRLHWIIVEDSTEQTLQVSKLVSRLNQQFGFDSITLLHEPTPSKFKLKPGEPSWKHPKGVWQRNKALLWLREHMSGLDARQDGAIYFADDDNTYDLELFNEMRFTERVSVWPVGLVGGLLVERPLVARDHNDIYRVTGFNSMWEPKRRFPLDMAGFSINIRLLLSKANASFSASQKIGYIESHFLGHFVSSINELEPRADGCSKILVWHTRTRNPVLHEERKLLRPSYEEIEW